MGNRIDELFKNKLEHHAAPPSGNAWQRIEGGLAKKNNAFDGWRIAAGVLLMVGLISALYWSQQSMVETNSNQPQRTSESTWVKQKTQPTLSEPHEPRTSIASSKSTNQKKKVTTSSVVIERESKSMVETQVLASSTKVEVTLEKMTAPLETSTTTEVAQIMKVEKPIVLEFTLAPITTEVTAQAEEKSNGFKKIFSKARDLKNGESGLDLAELTNKLFATNHKETKDNIN